MKICLECEGITDAAHQRCASCGVPLSPTEAVHFPLRRGEADAANPLLGTVVDGKYHIQGVLGKGGMGTVFRAIHQVSLVPVALKILNPRFSARREYREYFLAEAQKAGRVTHEHASRILDVGEAEDGTVYIAMEEVSGITLHECVHGAGKLAPALVVDVLVQICQALAAAHQAGLVHRDLSPRNVMVVVRHGAPFVKILDFGIAKGLPQAGGESQEPAGFANPPYSAPEHLEGGDVDARADLYSLGVIAYEALTQSLPVAGQNPRELAEATLRGELLPLQAPAGAPARLLRLVERLLARDPADRPASAEEVLHALQSIRQPGSRLLRDVAVLVFFVGVVVSAFAFTRQGTPALATRGDSPLVLGASAEELPEMQLQSEKLARLRFEYRGFKASTLVAEVERGQQTLFRDVVGAHSEGDGTLVLDREASVGYQRFLRRLAEESRAGPLVVTFLVEGSPGLGVARLQIDDIPPQLELRRHAADGDGSRLNGQSQLAFEVREEFGALQELTLHYRHENAEHVVDLRSRQSPQLASELLVQLPVQVEPMFVETWLTAEDRAGNRSESQKRQFEVDLRLPLPAPGVAVAALFRDGTRRAARLLLDLEQPEPGLEVLVRRHDGDGRRHRVQAQLTSHQLELTLEHDLVDGRFEFELKDPAGNRHLFTRSVTFNTHDPGFEWVSEKRLHDRLQAVGDELFWSGAAVEFSFRCNPYYRPAGLTLRGVPGNGEPEAAAELLAAHQGGGRIRLPELEGAVDGAVACELQIRLEPDAPAEVSWPLRLWPSPIKLRLPDTRAARFSRQLVEEIGLFERGASGGLQQTRAWIVEPPDARLLRARVVRGGGGEDSPIIQDLPPATRPDDPILPDFTPRAGANELGLVLHDVFDRPVEVFLGHAPAEHRTLPTGERVVRIAAFQHQLRVAHRPVGALLLEHGQPTRCTVHSPYRFDAQDRELITLLFQGEDLPCARIAPRGDAGTELSFEIPFRLMRQASHQDEDADALRREGFGFTADMELRTPAGLQRYEGVRVETIRSSLAQVRLGARFPRLDPVLAAIELVPVLRPLSVFEDRVTAELRERGGFLRRRAIPVKSIADCFLQQREVTRRQYLAIVDGFLRLLPEVRPVPQQIHFPGDPMGAERLTVAGMLPRIWEGAVGRWRTESMLAGDLPITGVTFYQAYAAVRMAGTLIAGDPECLRLPFGVELEIPGLGGRDPAEHVLNGVAGGLPLARLDGQDGVATPRGTIYGLDFGVREWVLDLPWPVAQANEQQIVAGWREDHVKHLNLAVHFASMSDNLAELCAWLQRNGVVRGVQVDELPHLRDLVTGEPSAPGRPLSPGVPGVVQTIFLDRSGEGPLLGRPHPLLRRVGFRLAAGDAFVRRVRTQ